MLDYYSVLQIEEDATQDEIKQAYHKMARLFHPDNFRGSQEEAAKQMAKINEAYQTLSDVDKRTVYDADRQLKSGKPHCDNNKRHDMHEENNTDSGTPKTNSMDGDDSTTPKTDHVYVENPAKPNPHKSPKRGCASCLAKIMKWAIYIGILSFIINHFHLVDKAKSLLHTFNPSQYSSEDKITDKLLKLKPEEVVEQYFKYIKNGRDVEANNLFSAKADENFQTCTVAQYNKVIVDLYYGFEKDIPTYPLFEEIRNFNYVISDVAVDEKEGYAEVNIKIENCDAALLFGMVMEADGNGNILATLSDSELQKIFRDAIKKYKDSCIINANAIITLKRDQDGCWKMDSISPLKDFSTVIIGQADELVLIMNGEEVGDDDSEKYENYDEDYEEDYNEDYEEKSDILW